MAFEPAQARPALADGTMLEALGYDEIDGWAEDDHGAALAALRRGCPPKRPPKLPLLDTAKTEALCRGAAAVEAGGARAFFEREFRPFRIAAPGFVTGYFEPEVAGSRTRTERFSVPLHRAPDDLVRLDDGARPAGLASGLSHARRTADGLVEHPERAAIEGGALDGRGLELVWVEDPLDAFFIHIQGSARIRLDDGSVMRIAYAAKSGQPYTAIGRILIERGEIAREAMSMETLHAWLAAHPDEAPELMHANRSYIFFRELEGVDPETGPEGAAGVALSAGRSLAVDETLVAYGLPLFVSASLPLGENGGGEPFRRLMIAQDTGSAIRGPARGDIFFGSGPAAGALAGRIRHAADFVLLLPRGSALAREAAGEHE